MTDKKLEILFSELTQDELKKISESPINTDCELEHETFLRISTKVQSTIRRESIYNKEVKSMKKSKKFKIALIAAVLAVVTAISAGAVYQFTLSDGLKDSLNLETVDKIKPIVDTVEANENTIKTMQKTVSTYGHTITFEAIVEGTAIKKDLEFIISEGVSGEAVEVDRNYAIFTITRDDGGTVLNNREYPRFITEIGYVVMLDNYAPRADMFNGNPIYYEEGNVLYFICDITDAYIFADRDLSIAVFDKFVVDTSILRVNEKGEQYFVESYQDIQAIFDFDLDDSFADPLAQQNRIAENPYVFNTNPDYTEADEILKKDMELINSGVDLSYAIGNRRWKGSYPLQFGKVEHAEDFIELYKNRATLDAVSFETYAECVNNALESQDTILIDFITEKTGKSIEDITDNELNALADEFESYKDEYCMFNKSYIDGKINLEKFDDGSEYAYLGENQFMYFPAGSENAKLVIVAGEKAVISLDISTDDVNNLFGHLNNKNYPSYAQNIWYLEGGANENSIYADAYNENEYNAYITNMLISNTEAIYNIAIEFAYYNGTIQVFAE